MMRLRLIKTAWMACKSTRRQRWMGIGVLALTSLTLASSGCASTPDQKSHFLRASEQVVASGSYRITPPDLIRIHCPIAPEIDGVVQRVRPDGKIALRLLGEVQIVGLTTQEASDKIATLLEQYYVDPDVVVNISGYASHFYYIFGEVASPGPRPYTGRDTLIRALAEARPNTFAWKSQIRITRPGSTAEDRSTIIVNLDEMLASGRNDQDVLLQPGDIIEVPPTPIAWVGHQVRALMYPVTPILDAYETPTDFIEANDTYNEQNNSSNNNGFIDRIRR